MAINENYSDTSKELTPFELYCHANELMDNKLYEQAAEYYQKFLESKKGTTDIKLSACDKLASLNAHFGNKEKERAFILKSFEYDPPHAEFCCRLGFDFLERNEIEKAIYWYKLATELKKPENTSVFYNEACWTWLPHLQLCVCYYRISEYEKAYEHVEKASSFQPENEIILKNKKLLKEQVNFKKKGVNRATVNLIILPKKHLKIVQVAPDVFPIPPENYGGIERVVFDLTEELVKRGHEVYLYAVKGSHSSATIIPYIHEGVDSGEIARYVASTLPQNVDLIHDHTHASVIDKLNLSVPTICTIHDSRANTAKNPVYLCKKALATVGNNNGYYVYNGIDPNGYDFSDKKDDYLLYLGVLNWHKGINHAINIAEKTKQKLVVAGPIFHADYFNKEIKPRMMNNIYIQYVGEVGGKVRRDLLKHAKCMVFPTSWEEPFGLVMVEAMVSGTPVFAFPNGAVPEILNGFPQLLCNCADEMADKVMNQKLPSSLELREYVMNNFTISIMTDRYLGVYNNVMNNAMPHLC